MGNEEICKHCKKPIAIRNPSGYCDHLYYPDNCEVCKSADKTGGKMTCKDCEQIQKEILMIIKEDDCMHLWDFYTQKYNKSMRVWDDLRKELSKFGIEETNSEITLSTGNLEEKKHG